MKALFAWVTIELVISLSMAIVYALLYWSIYRVSGRSILTQIAALLSGQNLTHIVAVSLLTSNYLRDPDTLVARARFYVAVELIFVGVTRTLFLVSFFLFAFLYRNFSIQVLNIYQCESVNHETITDMQRLLLYLLSFILPLIVGILHYLNIVDLINNSVEEQSRALHWAYYTSVQILLVYAVVPLLILVCSYNRIREHFRRIEERLLKTNFAARKERRMLLCIVFYALYLLNFVCYDVFSCVNHT